MFRLKAKDQCCGCTACIEICPTKALSFETDSEGFNYPKLEESKCCNCGLCEKVCPMKYERKAENKAEIGHIYCVQHKDKEARKSSTSGGAFSALADVMLKEGGIVYGAVFDEEMQVKHAAVAMLEELKLLRGSKYVQSELAGVFIEVEKSLRAGRKVLFSGTPCQIDGLKRYLQAAKVSKEQLYTIDVACHGAPSPKIWKEYVQYLEEKHHSKIQKVNFRAKDKGWHDSGLKIEFKNGSTYFGDMRQDPYYIFFFSHYSLRPSCYKCPYTKMERPGDITLADFWGIENDKVWDDNSGTSMVMINTRKGNWLWEKVSFLRWRDSDKKEITQPIFFKPSTQPENRNEFWKMYDSQSFEMLIKKYGTLSFVNKIIKYVIVPMLKKIGLYNWIVKKVFKIKK